MLMNVWVWNGIKWFIISMQCHLLNTNYCPCAYEAKFYILKYLLCKIFGVCIFYIDTSCGLWLEVKEIYGQNKVLSCQCYCLFLCLSVRARFHLDPSGTYTQYDAKAIGMHQAETLVVKFGC